MFKYPLFCILEKNHLLDSALQDQVNCCELQFFLNYMGYKKIVLCICIKFIAKHF